MSIFSGRAAYVNGVPCTQSWQASMATTHQRYSASCVAGATDTPPGIINWTGQVAGVGAQPPVFPDGEDFTFQGVMRDAAPLRSLNGTILFEQLTIDINKATNAAISWVATWGAQGALAQAATSAADAVVSEAENGKDLVIEIASVALTQNIQSCQLVFRRPHTTYVQGGLTYRKAGNLECDVNFAVLDDDLEVAAYAANALSQMDVFVDATHFWSLSKIRFGSKTNLNVDRTTHNILGYTVNGMWSGVEGDQLGFIDGPDGTRYWPPESSS